MPIKAGALFESLSVPIVDFAIGSESFEEKPTIYKEKTIIISLNSWKAVASCTAKVERRHYFLKIDEDANLIVSSNSRRRK